MEPYREHAFSGQDVIQALSRAAIAALFAVATQAQACSRAHVEVLTRYAPPWTNYPTLASLNAKYAKAGERTWLGSTSSRLQTDVTFRAATGSSDAQCAPATMRIDLSFAEHEVNIAAEVKSLPCLDRVVTQHELQHVSLNRRMLEQLRPVVATYAQDRLPQVLSNVPVTRQGSVASAFVETELKQKIDTYWMRLSQQQAALDNRQEYDKIASACPRELATLANTLELPAAAR